MAASTRTPAATGWLVRFRAAIASATDPAEVLTAYRAAWDTGNSPAMSSEVFRSIAYLPDLSRSVSLIASLPPVQKTLSVPASFVARGAETDVDVLRVIAAVLPAEELFVGLDQDAVEVRWALLRTRVLSTAADRGRVAHAAVAASVRCSGKQWVRERLQEWWRKRMLEEEREGILKAVDAAGVVLTPLVLAELGPEAERLYLTLRLPPPPSGLSAVLDGLHFGASQLLRPVAIRTDVRDARLGARERARVGTALASTRPSATAATLEVPALVDGAMQRADWHALPLIRLLHLRHLLDAPALNPGREVNEEALRALLHFFARENGVVDYWPEVRLHASVGRRWRARWAEVMGEAVAIAFLDAVLFLDFSTLTRVPESTDPTPDFKCTTTTGAYLAFEAKGTASKKTHAEQRRRALEQLGKAAKAGGRKSGRKTFRPFACSFLVGSEHREPSTLLHVADPPGDFDALFPEGWEEEARRTHLAAVCEAARLYSLADRVLGVEGEFAQDRTHDLVLPVGEEGVPCVGTELNLGREARRLGVDLAPGMRRATLFVGVEARVYRHLTSAMGRGVHADLPLNEPHYGLAATDDEALAFSCLPNGSVFAVRGLRHEHQERDG